VGALANPDVGEYLNEHFVCAFQKMGTFRVVNGQKQGGNVVSYFALPNGTVLHAVAGPVDAAELLREARWVVETRKMGIARSHGNMARYRAFWRQAHAERLQTDHGVVVNPKQLPRNVSLATPSPWAADPFGGRQFLNLQGQVHWLLAQKPLAKLDQISEGVFERVLGQRVSTLPVREN
jgi:hypothetical protein